jgi:type IV secretion system protein VirB10
MTEGIQSEPIQGSGSVEQGSIPGERGIASVNQVRSLQSRVTTWFGIGLMGLLALTLLTWYYRGALARQSAPREAAAKSLEHRAQGEMTLPPLGRAAVPVDDPLESSVLGSLLGPRPELPLQTSQRRVSYGQAGGASSTARPSALDRQLKGAVFAGLDRRDGNHGGSSVRGAEPELQLSAAGTVSSAQGADELGTLLTARATSAVAARVLPTQRLLLPKGAFLDCTLETAIDSSLPGMTTCITATDTYGADGSVILLERGSKLVGETRGQVREGSSRLFVLWSEARTPTGVVIPLASPGTDELGRSGMSGEVERHFWSRFGAAMLVSVVDGAAQSASRASNNSTLVISPTGTRDLATEVLRETVRVAPTLRKPQGDRIQVLVARDLDFRSVYRLTRIEE